ncbi:MAG: hypothetical protein DLM59_14685 [Pseudonocardiales bacterium]|nr:MAG: hypothetical protein DLM59_14685 [Pseudonocardiales bacterium]
MSSTRSTTSKRIWLFNDHGRRTLEWDDHRNRGYTRCILRENGGTLTGPPGSFIPVVPADLPRREAAASLPTLLDDLASWIDIDTVAWGQRHALITPCRILYALEIAEVVSKARWERALRTLARRWQRPMAQVRDERGLGWEPTAPPREGRQPAISARALPARGPNPLFG